MNSTPTLDTAAKKRERQIIITPGQAAEIINDGAVQRRNAILA